MQKLFRDKGGVIRFTPNKIVKFLLDTSKFNMNDLACMPFDSEDREHFAQLIGYSVAGFGELPYVSDEAYTEADTAAHKLITIDEAGVKNE